MNSDTLQEQLNDLTQRYEGQSLELHRLTSELFQAEERLRRGIATDLHDHVGQALAMIRFKLMELYGNAVFSGIDSNVSELKKLIDQTIAYTRSLTFDLSPPILYELGLKAALDKLTKQFTEKNKLTIKFIDDKASKKLSDETKIALYRSVNELLMNVVKHAKATEVHVTLSHINDGVEIRIKDNGKGFNVNRLESLTKNSFGLFSVKERMKNLNGSLDIISEPGKGTQVTLWTK